MVSNGDSLMSNSEDNKKYQALRYLITMTRDPDLVELATGWSQVIDFNLKNKVTRSNKATSDFSRNFNPQYIEQVQKAWAELLELSEREIEEAIELKEKQLLQEKQDNYPFNQPDAQFIDLDFWARAATWTDEQAVLLSLNRNPLPKYIDSIKGLASFEIQESKIAMNFFDRIALVKSAKEADQISKEGKSIEFVGWFQRMEFDVRMDLIEQVGRFQSNRPKPTIIIEGDLSEREKQTLLKIIAAMAVRGYRFDLNAKRNEATSDIKGDLELLGFNLDDKTILKWLRAATKLIDKDYWKES